MGDVDDYEAEGGEAPPPASRSPGGHGAAGTREDGGGAAVRSPIAGWLGAVIVVVVALLVVLGLWGLARQAPSSTIDPRLLPTATAVAAEDRFGPSVYPTAPPISITGGVPGDGRGQGTGDRRQENGSPDP